MNTSNNYESKNKAIIENVMRWILFGIIAVVIPPIFRVLFKFIVGYNILFSEYLSDIILAVLAISCNLINICTDSSKNIKYLWRWILNTFCGIISVGCWGLFVFISVFLDEEINNGVCLERYEGVAKMIFCISTSIIAFCTVIGIIIEVNTFKKCRNK